MKVTHYHLEPPMHGLWKQNAIVGREGYSIAPLIYLQRPKWIKDDDCWNKIINSVTIKLPKGYEVK